MKDSETKIKTFESPELNLKEEFKNNMELDYYQQMKDLEREIEILETRELYLKEELKDFKNEYGFLKEEVKKVQSTPLVIAQFIQVIDNDFALVLHECNKIFYVPILSTLDKELLTKNATVALNKESMALVGIMPPEAASSIKVLCEDEKPDVTFAMIGGQDIQKQELREAIELPLTCPELFKQVGIDSPRGVLMYGPPGCGKTMLAKAVANETKATFIRANGSDFVQKYLGDGPKMVRDIFALAKLNAPSIIFIDEIDSIGASRFNSSTGGDREVQRILTELLIQMDGFDQSVNVKVIMATNRADTLDPALLRPGRLDRKIAFSYLDKRQKRLVFSTVTAKMNLSLDIDLDECASRNDSFSGAEINSICQEAGMLAIRDNRYQVSSKDFEKAYSKVLKKDKELLDFYN